MLEQKSMRNVSEKSRCDKKNTQRCQNKSRNSSRMEIFEGAMDWVVCSAPHAVSINIILINSSPLMFVNKYVLTIEIDRDVYGSASHDGESASQKDRARSSSLAEGGMYVPPRT